MKLELYKPYRTRGGRKAVFVEHMYDDTYLVWHEGCGFFDHTVDGKLASPSEQTKYNIIEEWKEPRTLDVWVEVYTDNEGNTLTTTYDTEEECMASVTVDPNIKTIAVKKITITEGEGME